MNNKPVAWINRKGKDGEHGYLEWDKDDEAEINIPLYTHPVKELTDEEIWDVIDNCFGVHAFNLDYQISLDEAREDAFELVKAILKKA